MLTITIIICINNPSFFINEYELYDTHVDLTDQPTVNVSPCVWQFSFTDENNICLAPIFRSVDLFSAIMSLEKLINVRNSKPLSLFVSLFALACEIIFIKTHSTEKRFVIKPENNYTVFEALPRIFLPGNFTRWGREGFKERGKGVDG